MARGRGIVGTAALVLFVGCAAQGPEAAFEEALEGVRKGDARAVAERLSPRFEGPDGMDRGTAVFALAALFKGGKVGVTVLSQHVTLEGPSAATQTADLLFTHREGGALLPDDGGRRHALIRWERRGGAWLVREYREVGGS